MEEEKNLKGLEEKRAELQERATEILEKAKKETRAFTDEESKEFDEIEKEIEKIDKTIEAEERARNFEIKKGKKKMEEEKQENREEKELRCFANFIRGKVEERADVNMTQTENGAVVPSSIANKIIEKVVDMCPIYSMADRYNVKGTLNIPYYDEETQKIECEYAEEFTDGTSTSGKFASISLGGFLARALTKVSKSLMNKTDFDLVSFVVKKMGQAIAKFLEKELLFGTAGKITGLNSGVTQEVRAASATAITTDELIDLQETIPDVYQAGAIWIMNKATRTVIRKLKDSDGNYLLNKDMTAKWGYTLLGKPVYTSDNMPKMETGKTAIFYGDLEGLAVNVQEEVNIQILREKYAEQHCVGVLGFVEADSKVQDAQKLAKLVMA